MENGMTIKVKISNEDARETAVISVLKQEKSDQSPAAFAVELKGGESCEEYVHSTQQLLVKEVWQ
jgi:hypothetical protein